MSQCWIQCQGESLSLWGWRLAVSSWTPHCQATKSDTRTVRCCLISFPFSLQKARTMQSGVEKVHQWGGQLKGCLSSLVLILTGYPHQNSFFSFVFFFILFHQFSKLIARVSGWGSTAAPSMLVPKPRVGEILIMNCCLEWSFIPKKSYSLKKLFKTLCNIPQKSNYWPPLTPSQAPVYCLFISASPKIWNKKAKIGRKKYYFLQFSVSFAELLMKIPEASWKRIRLIHIFILCDFFWPFALLTLCSLWHSLRWLVVWERLESFGISFSLSACFQRLSCVRKKNTTSKQKIASPSTESLSLSELFFEPLRHAETQLSGYREQRDGNVEILFWLVTTCVALT